MLPFQNHSSSIPVRIHLLFQICFKEATVFLQRWLQFMKFSCLVEVEFVRAWSSWSAWEWGSDLLRLERSRACCAESCSGEDVERRPAELGERKTRI